MLRCNKIRAISLKKFSFTAAIFSAVFFTQNLSAQNSIAPVAPVAPVRPVAPVADVEPVTLSPSFQTVPQMSSPVTGQNYYTPGQSVKSVKSQEQPKTTETQQTTTTVSTSTQTKTTDALLNQFGQLSATDLAALSKQGLITNVSSLLGGNTSLLNGGVNSNESSQTVLLNKILTELTEIKEKQAKLETVDYAKLKPSAEPPAILRFVVNNFDVLKSCSAVYFSKPETDGSFLLTGDTRSIMGSTTISETFYMLFKACGTENGHCMYSVELSLSQDYQNNNTALYKLCTKNCLKATKTGNLITLRQNDSDVRSDMLIDIGM